MATVALQLVLTLMLITQHFSEVTSTSWSHTYLVDTYVFAPKRDKYGLELVAIVVKKKMIPCILLMLHWPVKPHTMLLVRYVLAQQGSPECAVT